MRESENEQVRETERDREFLFGLGWGQMSPLI